MTVAILEKSGTYDQFDALVRENVDFTFRGFIENEEGIGSSDIGACSRYIAADLGLIAFCGDFEGFQKMDTLDKMWIRKAINLALLQLEAEIQDR